MYLLNCPSLIPFLYLLSLSRLRDRSKKTCFHSNLWHPTLNTHLRSPLRSGLELWRAPDLHHFLPGWELAATTPSTLFDLEVVAKSLGHSGVCLCAVAGISVLWESLWLCSSQWKHKRHQGAWALISSCCLMCVVTVMIWIKISLNSWSL